jgi:hypothetical protein
MSQNVLVKNATGRKGWGLHGLPSIHGFKTDKRSLSQLHAWALCSWKQAVLNIPHRVAKYREEWYSVNRHVWGHYSYMSVSRSTFNPPGMGSRYIYTVSFVPSSAWSPFPGSECSRKNRSLGHPDLVK